MKPEFDGVVFDSDGVLTYQGNVFDGAIELFDLLIRNKVPYQILTNSTLQSRRSCARRMREKGFPITWRQVITASYATACYLRQRNPRSIHLMLEGEGREEFQGFVLDEQKPQYLVLGDCRDGFNFRNLNGALRILSGGAGFIVMIPEITDSSLGSLELTAGAYGGML